MVKRILQGTLALAAAAALAAVSPVAAQASSLAPGGSSARATTAHACAEPLHPGAPVCYALVRTDVSAVRANALSPDATPSGYGPSDLQRAYNLAAAAASNGGGATVAVAELADDPNLESDLGTYRAQYGLPACTTANGCFRKVNQSGQQGNYPPGDTGWGTEASLDVDMVSAICPNCHILVVEAGDLNAAQNTAVSLGAHFISNSWGTGDGSFDSGADADYNHAGVVDVASSGDSGYGVSFPATSQYVVAAGGTSLRQASGTARGWSETVWSGAGAGCSSWEAKPSWQHDSGCGHRTVADVSAVADPGTGVAVYDTYGQGGWFVVGGTSVSSPIIASVYALAGAPASAAASLLYSHASSLNDVTSGSDGSCSPAYLCTGTAGYDGPTGLGTPNGLGAFNGSGGGTQHTGPITSGVSSSLCLDDRSSSTTNFNPVQIWGCNGTGAQQWTVSGSTLQVLGKCLDVNSAGTADGTTVDLYDCNGTGAQVWQPQSNGSLLNPNSGKCLDDPNSSTTAGTQLQIWDCNGTGAQHWTLP
ncbi:ricin-type beta-trefoil lectin domain protein [Actinacidiphila acidipaludis]|uniref:Ricin-type beta-trefoil lectin domain protein n=1 Tax=Actinacidiphila acidipaludis TaxID=2873382 RepID=A0ABS7QDP0_9ACTN|nr:ricin-type beta-trefoil lectin domain protein [Streptomyces acidipaludis]MBY8881290.1 ricin-type beta-trefoil lectin domain protein [Streptomyces acidipaludis]